MSYRFAFETASHVSVIERLPPCETTMFFGDESAERVPESESVIFSISGEGTISSEQEKNAKTIKIAMKILRKFLIMLMILFRMKTFFNRQLLFYILRERFLFFRLVLPANPPFFSHSVPVL